MKEYTEHKLYGGKVVIKFYPQSHQYWVSDNGSPFKRASGVTTFIGIKDKSRALGMWQQQITADFLLKKIEAEEKIDIDAILEAAVQNDVIRDKAADIGKEIHDWCEHYIKRKLKVDSYKDMPPIPEFPEAVNGVNAFLDWDKKHKAKFISSERVVYSRKYGYMGTMDLEAEIDEIHCVGDFKSSNGLYNGVRMQTAAYAMADMEERGKKIHKGRWAIRMSKFSEADYLVKEERKKELKKAIARIKGIAFKDYEIKPYQVFEAKFLDDKKDYLERDFEAFLHAKALYEWNNDTDPFYKGDNW